jgi:hypothetical protein
MQPNWVILARVDQTFDYNEELHYPNEMVNWKRDSDNIKFILKNRVYAKRFRKVLQTF